MTKDEAIEKVQKLLALAQSDNAHEAASAMKQAQKLLLQHGIEREMLDEHEKEEPIADGGTVHRTSPFNMDTWCIRLADVLARANQSRALIFATSVEKRIELYGRPSDVQTVRYLYDFYSAQIHRLCDRDGKGQGRTWRNNFRHGCVDTLAVQLIAARQEMTTTNENKRGLVRLDQRGDAVDEWMRKQLKVKRVKLKPMLEDDMARYKGQRAGEEIHHTKARGALK